MLESRFAYAQFFDDVRQEISGKITYVGGYNTTMIVAQIPAMLHKLCAQIVVVTPIDNPMKSLVLRAKLNGEQIGELAYEPANLNPRTRDENTPPEPTRILVSGIMTFQPLIIDEPGMLRIEAETESEIIHAGSLYIRANNVQAQE